MKRLFALLLTAALALSLAACGAPASEAPAPKPGRWVEEEIDVPAPEGASFRQYFKNDTTLDVVFYDDVHAVVGWSRTQDGCETWQTMDISFLDEPMSAFSHPYCELSIGPNSQVWFSLAEGSGDEAALHEAVSEWYGTSESESDTPFAAKEVFYYYLQDGAAVPVPNPFEEAADTPYSNVNYRPFYPLANGDCLFDNCWVAAGGREIWRVDPSGRQVASYTVKEPGMAFPYLSAMFTPGSVVGDQVLAHGMDSAFLLDLNDGFTQEIPVKAMPAGLNGEGTLYTISSQSIQQLKAGSTLVEELVSGREYYFGGSSNSFSAVFPMDEYIYAVVNEGRLFRYHYDANAVLADEGALTVFSMHDDTAVRQTIAELRLEKPGLTIEYRIGDEEMAGGLTKDDLVKSLNTELLAGTGPDVLILDDMAPLGSYLESGVFADLTELIDTTGLYQNLLACGQYEGRQYAIPAGIGFPALLSYYNDIEGRLDGVDPNEVIPRVSDEALPSYPTLAPLLTDSQQQFERGISQKIGDAGLTKQVCLLDNYWALSSDALYLAALPELTDPAAGREHIKEFLQLVSWMDPASQTQQVQGHHPYNLLAAEFYCGLPFRNYQNVAPLPSLSGKKVYCPYSMAAIPEKKDGSENAVAFINTMLSEGVQSQLLGVSVPAYMSASSQFSHSSSGSSSCIPLRESCLKSSTAPSLAGPSLPSSLFPAMRQAVRQLDTPVIPDAARAEAFNTAVIDYLQGVLTLDEAADAIIEASSREDTLSALEREK